MTEYRYERINENSYKDLVCLFKNSFGLKININYFKNLNNSASFNCPIKNLGFIAYDQNNEPAAFYGVYPYLFEYQGEIILAAQSGNTMTHSHHRGKGLFIILAKMTYELAKENGVEFIFGFPNENSYPGFVRKLSWIHKENMKQYKISVFTFPLAKVAKKIFIFKLFYDEFVKLFFGFLRTNNPYFGSSIMDNETAGVFRNEAFYNYKSFSNNYLIKLGKVRLWVKVNGGLDIGDIERNDDFDYDKFIKQLKKMAFWLGASRIRFEVSPNTYFDKIFENQVKAEKGSPIGYLNLNSDIPLEKIRFVMGDFDTF